MPDMPSLVALDLETTGLDPSTDAIIEIGAVRFNGSRVEAEFNTLVNPNRPIPAFITQLTGINNEMVRNAPPFGAVARQLADFIGDSPVVAHNARFDVGFLQKRGLLPYNDVIDTYELAAVMMPTASRYNLGSLGQILGILIPNSHRALDDARLAHAVYWRLFQKAMELPVDIIAEFVRQSEHLDWDAANVFRQVLKERARQPIAPRRVDGHSLEGLFQTEKVLLAPEINARCQPAPLDIDEVAAHLEHGSDFSRHFRQFESRPQQTQMLRAICEALNGHRHLLVEAGTGTGKSFAYLIPAAIWAVENNTRVMVSTNTINLQDQLIKKDIPDLCAALKLDLRATVLKGRNNYLCPRRLEALRQRGPENPDEMRILAKLLVWIEQGGQGDRHEINLNGPAERDLWNRLSADDETCQPEVCLSRRGGLCPFYKARMEAQNAHLVVVNHALLLADAVSGSRVLPEYEYLIIDEGHHIESATTNALSYQVSQTDLQRMLRELGSSSTGILGRLLRVLQGEVRPSDLAVMHAAVDKATDAAFRLERDLRQFFASIENFMESMREGQPVSGYGQTQHLLPSTRRLPAWDEVAITWDNTQTTMNQLLEHIDRIHSSIGVLQPEPGPDLEDVSGSLGTLYRRLCEAREYLVAIIAEPKSSEVYWVEIHPNNYHLSLQAAPLHVGELMERYLWNEKSSIILTSATLTTQGEFDYLRGRLNAAEADDLKVDSPFDYENAALLYLVNDIPEPSDASRFQRSVEKALTSLGKATGGRMLALFTSYAQLKRTSQAIGPVLAEQGIEVYEQGEGASASTLLETFREAEKAVLLGTKAFWEGVDIPGDALSVLVIVKLPFDVPTEPIIAARAETFEDPFNEYNLPEAILRFRQGFGRLIRTQSDRGVVVILDRRILTKHYGQSFLSSLPKCRVVSGSLHNLPATASRWLNL